MDTRPESEDITDARPKGMTLETEERMRAREAELRRMNQRADAQQDSDREARTRRAATAASH